MQSSWFLTWHEDGQVSPGVPDASYVMNDGGYETGWLELKAGEFVIRPSQHQWIEKHWRRVPIHVLIEVGHLWYLVPGEFHASIHNEASVIQHCQTSFPITEAAERLPTLLRYATNRRR